MLANKLNARPFRIKLDEKDSAETNKNGRLIHKSTYETFLYNLLMSARREGLYVLSNFSRPVLG